jgi:hypothetical protein
VSSKNYANGKILAPIENKVVGKILAPCEN